MGGQPLIDLLSHFKYEILFPAAVIEGPIVTVVVGFLSSQGVMNGPISFVIAVAADLVSDTVWYVLGRFGYSLLSPKVKEFLGIKDPLLRKFQRQMNRHFGKIIFIGKFTQVFASIIELAAGLAKVDFARFLLINFLNTAAKSAIFFVIGVFFGKAYEEINAYLSIYSTAILILSIILSIVLTRYVMKKQAEKNDFFNS